MSYNSYVIFPPQSDLCNWLVIIDYGTNLFSTWGIYVPLLLPIYNDIWAHTYLHINNLTIYIYTCIHKYIHAYVHTYMHTRIHTWYIYTNLAVDKRYVTEFNTFLDFSAAFDCVNHCILLKVLQLSSGIYPEIFLHLTCALVPRTFSLQLSNFIHHFCALWSCIS